MTTDQWVIPFYKKQFEWLHDVETEMASYLQQEADNIEEQIGVNFKSMLDIGAGIGSIARHFRRPRQRHDNVRTCT